MADSAAEAIVELGLTAHPEGGFYRELYRSEQTVMTPRGERSSLTVIHFLLRAGDVSTWHRLRSDETWHFIRGSRVRIETIVPGCGHISLALGGGEASEVVLPAGTLFAATTVDESPGYGLVSCCVAPGFDFDDFEMPELQQLVTSYPEHTALFERYARR